jgi:two-component system, NtrC family, response regulator HydG
MAHKGTLFLDEVSNLPLDVQASLLRVTQEEKCRRIGSGVQQNVDLRIIVASNENLQTAYRTGKFRDDLYHRLNELKIELPSLRYRKEDILPFPNIFFQGSMKNYVRTYMALIKEYRIFFLRINGREICVN